MVCVFCKNEIDDASTVCPYCNQPVAPAAQPQGYSYAPTEQSINMQGEYHAAPQQSNENGYYNQGQYNTGQQGYYQQPFNQPFVNIPSEVNTAKTLGIISIIVGLFVSSIVGLILGCVGSSKISTLYATYPFSTEIKQAKSLNSWGIGISVARIAIVILIYILAAVVFGAVSGISSFL